MAASKSSRACGCSTWRTIRSDRAWASARHLAELRAVYLNCNMLREVDNLSANEQLTLLNLATNQISAFAPDSLPRSLNTLECANNILERADALAPLALLPNLEVLNLQNNRLADERLFLLFSSFPALRVLYLQGNPIQRAENYRRRLVSGCVHTHLPRRLPRGDVGETRRGGVGRRRRRSRTRRATRAPRR